MSEVLYFLKRNRTSITQRPVRQHQVNLEWWNKTLNLGDALAPVLYTYMLRRKKIKPDQKTDRTIHLMTIGSLIGMGNFDAVIWGSGVHTRDMIQNVNRHKGYVKYDIRAVRGPLTAEVLKKAGYKCPDAYGDPSVLMPLLYRTENLDKKYQVSLIAHYKDAVTAPDDFHRIDIRTKNYRRVIDEITASELIISSSLHGIILAEAYGIPAVFLNQNHSRDLELMKYHDWYYSTGRRNVRTAHSVEEAARMSPMDIPDLKEMQRTLIETFPYDLWAKRT